MGRVHPAALLAVAVVAVALAGAAAAADGAGASTSTAPESAFVLPDIDEDSVEMEATLRDDGDADWRVVYRVELDGDEEREAFEELQAEIEEDPAAYLEPFEERIQRTVDDAAAATDREMAAESFSVETARSSQADREFGTVTFGFEWRGFATVEDDGATIRAGDAVGGLFLDEETSFALRWDEAYALDSHTPEGDSVEETRVAWNGPREFTADEPRVVLTAGDSGTDLLPATPLLLSALVVAALVLVVVTVARRRGFAGAVGPEPAPEAGGGAEAAGDGAEAEMGTDVPSELLSNEERVLALLESNDGRIKQKAVAETLEWSPAKTSQVVGSLREDDAVETFRIGRENVLTLPDVDIIPDQDGENDEDDL